MVTTISSCEFNQDASGAQRTAQAGPVFVTDRGTPSHVLLTFEEYRRLARDRPTLAELLSAPPGIEDVDFAVPAVDDLARPARFE